MGSDPDSAISRRSDPDPQSCLEHLFVCSLLYIRIRMVVIPTCTYSCKIWRKHHLFSHNKLIMFLIHDLSNNELIKIMREKTGEIRKISFTLQVLGAKSSMNCLSSSPSVTHPLSHSKTLSLDSFLCLLYLKKNVGYRTFFVKRKMFLRLMRLMPCKFVSHSVRQSLVKPCINFGL